MQFDFSATEVLGQTNGKRLPFLVFTIRNKKIRPISARDQNKKEKGGYQVIGGENQ